MPVHKTEWDFTCRQCGQTVAPKATSCAACGRYHVTLGILEEGNWREKPCNVLLMLSRPYKKWQLSAAWGEKGRIWDIQEFGTKKAALDAAGRMVTDGIRILPIKGEVTKQEWDEYFAQLDAKDLEKRLAANAARRLERAPLVPLARNVADGWDLDSRIQYWEPPRRIVTGESLHQDSLQFLARHPEDWCVVPVPVTFRAGGAVRVFVGPLEVGEVHPRLVCQVSRDLRRAHLDECTLAGVITGGGLLDNGDWALLGCHVWVDKRLSPAISFEVEDKFWVNWPHEDFSLRLRRSSIANAL